MKKLSNVRQLIQFVSKDLSYLEIQSRDVEKDNSSESLLFVATKDFFFQDLKLYDLIINKIAILQSENSRDFIAFHTFFYPEKRLVDKIIADIGNFEISGTWGIDNGDEAKIFTWSFQKYNVTLNKKFRNLKDMHLESPYDVLTVSTNDYERIKTDVYSSFGK
jgi:hypothetical protein